MFCVACGASNDPGAQYCVKCGTPLGAAKPAVPSVTEPSSAPAQPAIQPPPRQDPPYIPPAASYPPGYPTGSLADPNAKSRLAAGLLGIFLGWLGIHRFYLGYTNIAVAQLAVGLIGMATWWFTCGLLLIVATIWGLVDGIMILSGSIGTDGQGRPLRD